MKTTPDKDKAYNRYEQAARTAAAKGLRIVVPSSNQLQVDIDNQADLEVFFVNYIRLCKTEQQTYDATPTFEKHPSPSGKDNRYHIVVTLGRDVQGPAERILLQSLLGSDRVREALSWQRMVSGDPTPTLFFEKSICVTPITVTPEEID